MSKIKYVLGACAIALTLSGTALGNGYVNTGDWSGYCGTKTLLYCQDGICYYSNGASFTNPDGTHVISQSGVTPQ